MIYLLEDDSSIRELVAYTLTGSVMPTVGFERPSEFRAALEREKPALAILDIMLPDIDGFEVCRNIREKLLCCFGFLAARAGKRAFTLPFSFTELAAYVCADRSALMRELSHMRAAGLVRTEGRNIELL